MQLFTEADTGTKQINWERRSKEQKLTVSQGFIVEIAFLIIVLFKGNRDNTWFLLLHNLMVK